MSAHAILSASGAKRWLTCPPSARLEEQYDDQTSEYAEEGTAAHALAEAHLGYNEKIVAKARKSKYYDQAMEDYVARYVDIVLERYAEAQERSKDALLLLEQRLDFSEWVPEGFGTGDVVIISDGVLEVIDLKYGKGVQVEAEDNPQLRLYGLGAWQAWELVYDIRSVRMTIVHPRLDHVSTCEMVTEDLLEWADQYVKPRAALAWDGGGEYQAGDHCRFCKARATCRTRAEANLALAAYDFRQGPELDQSEIADILGRIDDLVSWAGDVKAYALEQAEKHGVKWPGWKLVAGRSNRKYADSDQVAAALVAAGYDEALIYERSLLGITAMEKTVGKKAFAEILGDLVVKPEGKPTLAPENDKRPELNTTAQAAEDFK